MSEDLTPEQRQDAALAALAAPVLRHRGIKPAKAMEEREETAAALAVVEGFPDAQAWANENFRPKGVRRG